MLTRYAPLTILVLAVILGGCGMQKGQTEVKYSKGTTMSLSEATKTGDYALYTTTDITPKVVRHVNEGDPLGFRKTPDGNVEAVAGTFTMPLASSTRQAYWKYYTK